jgi:outer membrane protein assembly factor BamE (lipoprotein component of BamABCDE complex)
VGYQVDAQRYFKVQAGMNQAEVRALMGTPYQIHPDTNKWTYFIVANCPCNRVYIEFDDTGKVTAQGWAD